MENHKEIPDLDHLKAAWNQELEQQAAADTFINHQNLQTMIHQRTQSTLMHLKRNLLIEIISTAVLIAVAFGYAVGFDKNITPFFWIAIIPVTFFGHIALYVSLYRQERRSATHLKESLQTSVRHTGRFIQLAERTAWVAAGYILVCGLYIIFKRDMSFLIGLVQLGIVILAAIVICFFVHFYIEKLYGQYYRQLLKHQEELLA
jgi:hypothetical protein